mgnify:CR=1 FL=1
MALKKATSTAKTAAKKTAEVKAEPAKTAEKAVKAEPAKTAVKAEKAEPAKAIETKKDTTKKLETKAAVLVDTPAEKAAEKTTAKKTAPKKTAAKKTTVAKKTTAKKTTTVKKTAAEKAEIKTEIFLQFSGKEYTQDEILQKVKDIWTYDLNNNVDDIKDVQIYLKPEESAAYYVVNGNTTGKVVL